MVMGNKRKQNSRRIYFFEKYSVNVLDYNTNCFELSLLDKDSLVKLWRKGTQISSSSREFEFSRVWVIEDKITVNVCQKSRRNQFWSALASSSFGTRLHSHADIRLLAD